MKPIIRVENISKQYRLGDIGTGTIRDDFNRWWHRSRGKEDPFLKIGESNDRSQKGESDYVWVLRDICFDVMPGDVVGIIGKNGAGKSTLLKILSKVTGPTTGRIDFNGRIASLLEVGTGFHPDLTGRENIFLNGAILGMTSREIRAKLDEIVDFSGCERYIDTPTKRYSSGMIVRLGFAVAAHLNPEILIVDEVLAVGDAEFQKKAIGKMQDVNKNEGRTVLFVSHNMTVINELCKTGLLLEHGRVKLDSSIGEVMVNYLNSTSLKTTREWTGPDAPGTETVKLRKAYIINKNNEKLKFAYINESFAFCVEYEILAESDFFTHGINVSNGMELHMFTSHDSLTFQKESKLAKGYYKTIVWIPANLLQNEMVEFSFALMRYDPFELLFYGEKMIKVDMVESPNTVARSNNYKGKMPGLIRPLLTWEERQSIN